MQRLDTSYLNQPAPNNLESPLESLAKVTQYRNMLTQGRLHEQQIANEQAVLKQHQLAIDETQRAQKDSADYDAAFKEAGGNFQQARANAISRGVRSQFIEKRDDEYQKHIEQLSKADAEKTKAAEAHVNYLHERLSPIAAVADPVQQGALFNAFQSQAVKEGTMKPEEAIQYAGPSQVQDLLAQNTLRKNMLTDAKEKREADEAARKEAKAPAEQTEAEQKALKATQETTGTVPMQPKDIATLAREKARDLQITTNEQAMRGIQQQNANTAAGHLAETKRVNAMEYGPGQIDNWVKNLQDNPDSVKELPPKLRGVVGQKFTESTGLPLPTPLGAAGQTQETAARNALDGITFIRQAVKNPEIAAQIGPIMGRLGNAEQAVGTAVGLSPEAEKMAQELRTRMRYFVFQEGKAVLGGRLPQQLMGALESSSANIHMSPAMLEGALSGAEGNAQSVMENADKQRFGGKARTPAMRGIQQAPAAKAKLNVISPEGLPGTIDADKWEAAQKRGFKKQ